MRVVRAVVGTLLLLIGLPLLLAGGALWFATQHQEPTGGYSARLATITTDGHAIVVSNVDALLRREVPFARGGRTTLRLAARTEDGPAFVGLAPAGEAARYLAGVPYTRVDRVRLARGPLPVATAAVAGTGEPATAPQEQRFWLAGSGVGALEWRPDQLRGERLALVVMDPQARAPLSVDLTARLEPQWLGSTTVGLLVLGAVLVLVAVATLAWPGRTREIIYVVPPAQMPEVAAHLGMPVPHGPPPPAGEPEPTLVGQARVPAPPGAVDDPAPTAPAAPLPEVPEPRAPEAGAPEAGARPTAGDPAGPDLPTGQSVPPDLAWPPLPPDQEGGEDEHPTVGNRDGAVSSG